MTSRVFLSCFPLASLSVGSLSVREICKLENFAYFNKFFKLSWAKMCIKLRWINYTFKHIASWPNICGLFWCCFIRRTAVYFSYLWKVCESNNLIKYDFLEDFTEISNGQDIFSTFSLNRQHLIIIGCLAFS